MSRLIQIGAGVGAVAIAVVLGVALLPQVQEAARAGKQAVAKPVFVATPPAAVAPASAAPSEPAKEAALVKLAEALRVAPVAGAPTRSLSYAPADSAKPASAALPAVAAVAPVSEEARQHCAQGLVALANGEIGAARALLLRAADEGDARALMALGETWEPATLAGLGAVGAKGDPARARDYYNKALAAGVGAARERLAALESN